MSSIWKPKSLPSSQSKLVRYLSNTRFGQNYAFYLSMVFVSSILKLYVVSVLCMVFSFSPLFDFFLQILISILVHFMWSDSCVRFLSTNSKLFRLDKKIKRLLSDLSDEKVDRMKRVLFIGASLLSMSFLYFIDVTSHLLIVYILQNMVIVVCIDILSKINFTLLWKNTVKRVYHRYETIDPQGALVKKIEPCNVKQNYFESTTEVVHQPILISNIRSIEKERRRFRLTRLVRYVFPKKY